MESELRKQMAAKELVHQVKGYCKNNKISNSRRKKFVKAFFLLNQVRNGAEGLCFDVMLLSLNLIEDNAGPENENENMKSAALDWFRHCAGVGGSSGELDIFEFVLFLTHRPWGKVRGVWWIR